MSNGRFFGSMDGLLKGISLGLACNVSAVDGKGTTLIQPSLTYAVGPSGIPFLFGDIRLSVSFVIAVVSDTVIGRLECPGKDQDDHFVPRDFLDRRQKGGSIRGMNMDTDTHVLATEVAMFDTHESRHESHRVCTFYLGIEGGLSGDIHGVPSIESEEGEVVSGAAFPGTPNVKRVFTYLYPEFTSVVVWVGSLGYCDDIRVVCVHAGPPSCFT
jgi:hypothetical protein